MDPHRLQTSGRRLTGPVSDLVELHQDGDVWLAQCHHPRFQRPDVIDDLLADAGNFLRDPAVEGIVELDAWDREGHRLLYPTQRVWTVADLLQGAKAAGKPLGLRAGLELAYVVGLLLQDGHEAGEDRGAPFHGDLDPWNIVLDDDADVHLIGWGVPPLALYLLDEDDDADLPGDVFRYCPPERYRGDDEDLSTDLFALGLIAVEAMTGTPLYNGQPHEIRRQAEHCETERRLFRLGDSIPEDVRRFLGRVLDPYPDARHHDVDDFLMEAHDLLYGPCTDDMATLADAVATYGVGGPRLPRIPEASAPRWADPSQSRGGPSDSSQSRWERPRRSRTDRRPTRTPEDPEVAHPLGARTSRSGPSSAADALRERLSASRHDREEVLRERLTRASTRSPRAPVRDRNGLFPRSPLTGDHALRYLIELPDGGTVWTRLSPEETLALSAARVADKACPTPVDPTGSLMGWYRLEQGGSGWFGDTRTSVLSADDPVTLAFVPNRVVQVELRIEGHEDAGVHLDVGTAVHVQFLVSHLRQRFQLRARDWELWIEEARTLDRWQILDDYDPDAGLVLRMVRTRRRRSLRRR